jgi:hypothetical protein
MPEQDSIFTIVQRNAIEKLTFTQLKSTNLHIQQEVLKKGAVIEAHRQQIPVDKDTVMVFADDAPLFNWSHPCRYLLFDATTAEIYREVHAQFPPYLVSTPKNFRGFHLPVTATSLTIQPFTPIFRCPIRFPVGARYAILFSGASNNRHTNDVEFLYRTLRDHYGFVDANIYVLNYDGTHGYNAYGSVPGTTWPGDNTPYRMPVKGKGTKDALNAALDEVKGRLKKNDLLLIHINNHGGYDGPGKAYLCTYAGDDYYAAEFGAKLGTLPNYDTLMVMMEQCHSGGFNASILAHSTASKTTVASACVETANSIGGADFDPFARDWIAGMTGNDPYGHALAFNPDTDGNGRIYAEEAFAYADAVHDPYDTPTYSETSEAAGDTYLGQRYAWWWWYCPLVSKALQPYYTALALPEFHEKVHTVLEPRLLEIQTKLDLASDNLRKEVEPQIKQIVDTVFKSKGTGTAA